jgi:hypothetical protein
MKKRVYLDVSTLCRPFDDQSFVRIRPETEAFNLVLSNIRSGNLSLMVSPVHYREVADISESEERIQIETILRSLGNSIETNLIRARERTLDLMRCGVGVADAAHLAFAEAAHADFISCDDKLIRKCKKCDVRVWAGTPLAFCDKENLR